MSNARLLSDAQRLRLINQLLQAAIEVSRPITATEIMDEIEAARAAEASDEE